jgi:hypothetical protein
MGGRQFYGALLPADTSPSTGPLGASLIDFLKAGGNSAGGAGTVLTADSSTVGALGHAKVRLIVDNTLLSSAPRVTGYPLVSPIVALSTAVSLYSGWLISEGTVSVDELTLRGGGHLSLRNSTLSLNMFSTACDSTGSLSMYTGGMLVPSAASSALGILNARVTLKTVGALPSAFALTVGSGGELQLSAVSSTTTAGSNTAAAAAGAHTLATLTIATGGALTVLADVAGTGASLTVTGTFNVASGGTVSASGSGYPGVSPGGIGSLSGGPAVGTSSTLYGLGVCCNVCEHIHVLCV